MTPEELADAATSREGHGSWSHVEMLLAEIADRLAEQTWVLGQWKKRPRRPDRLPRPGVADPRATGPAAPRRARTLDEVMAAADPAAVAAARELLAHRPPRGSTR